MSFFDGFFHAGRILRLHPLYGYSLIQTFFAVSAHLHKVHASYWYAILYSLGVLIYLPLMTISSQPLVELMNECHRLCTPQLCEGLTKWHCYSSYSQKQKLCSSFLRWGAAGRLNTVAFIPAIAACQTLMWLSCWCYTFCLWKSVEIHSMSPKLYSPILHIFRFRIYFIFLTYPENSPTALVWCHLVQVPARLKFFQCKFLFITYCLILFLDSFVQLLLCIHKFFCELNFRSSIFTYSDRFDRNGKFRLYCHRNTSLCAPSCLLFVSIIPVIFAAPLNTLACSVSFTSQTPRHQSLSVKAVDTFFSIILLVFALP